MTRYLVAPVTIAAVLADPCVASAADFTIWTTRAIATVLAEIGGEFERATGHRLIVTSDLPQASSAGHEPGSRSTF